MTGGADQDWFVFKNETNNLGYKDTIKDFEDGLDRIAFDDLGVTRYSASGGNGTVRAYDMADGSVSLDVTTSHGNHFTIAIADPLGKLSAANFSSSDFIFG